MSKSRRAGRGRNTAPPLPAPLPQNHLSKSCPTAPAGPFAMSHATTYVRDGSISRAGYRDAYPVVSSHKRRGGAKGKCQDETGERNNHQFLRLVPHIRTPHIPHTLPSTSSGRGGARAQHQIRPCWYNSVLSSISLPRRCQWPAGRSLSLWQRVNVALLCDIIFLPPVAACTGGVARLHRPPSFLLPSPSCVRDIQRLGVGISVRLATELDLMSLFLLLTGNHLMT
ncbi:hypothetical protein LX32DRAFT_330060 [Colletotrichum zoysiae]|uniref:Uncharacterized protein n=1 Tax=Colletotrichum zoysiae TaxID=1216348 RepID=A0AAD9HLM6_9PEZI|nr:hypothetical protein LX32DRAFT_330060 [Colletotrichum zoysiae]